MLACSCSDAAVSERQRCCALPPNVASNVLADEAAKVAKRTDLPALGDLSAQTTSMRVVSAVVRVQSLGRTGVELLSHRERTLQSRTSRFKRLQGCLFTELCASCAPRPLRANAKCKYASGGRLLLSKCRVADCHTSHTTHTVALLLGLYQHSEVLRHALFATRGWHGRKSGALISPL